jgi:hypothetical protein
MQEKYPCPLQEQFLRNPPRSNLPDGADASHDSVPSVGSQTLLWIAGSPPVSISIIARTTRPRNIHVGVLPWCFPHHRLGNRGEQ